MTHRVVEHPILVSLIRVKLHRPAMDITEGICRAALRPDGRNAQEDIGFLANRVEEAS